MEATHEQSLADEVKSRVSAYIDGKHSRIGLIFPKHDPDPDDFSDLYHTLAEIHVRQAKRKAAQD